MGITSTQPAKYQIGAYVQTDRRGIVRWGRIVGREDAGRRRGHRPGWLYLVHGADGEAFEVREEDVTQQPMLETADA